MCRVFIWCVGGECCSFAPLIIIHFVEMAWFLPNFAAFLGKVYIQTGVRMVLTRQSFKWTKCAFCHHRSFKPQLVIGKIWKTLQTVALQKSAWFWGKAPHRLQKAQQAVQCGCPPWGYTRVSIYIYKKNRLRHWLIHWFVNALPICYTWGLKISEVHSCHGVTAKLECPETVLVLGKENEDSVFLWTRHYFSYASKYTSSFYWYVQPLQISKHLFYGFP